MIDFYRKGKKKMSYIYKYMKVEIQILYIKQIYYKFLVKQCSMKQELEKKVIVVEYVVDINNININILIY